MEPDAPQTELSRLLEATAARFLRLCNAHGIAVLSLRDTPGFMVGPGSEKQAALRYMSDLFVAGTRRLVSRAFAAAAA